MLGVPIANEAHLVYELAVGGPIVGICALIGSALGYFNTPEDERSDAVRKGFLIGGIVGFVLRRHATSAGGASLMLWTRVTTGGRPIRSESA
jgi:hypothetical protein